MFKNYDYEKIMQRHRGDIYAASDDMKKEVSMLWPKRHHWIARKRIKSALGILETLRYRQGKIQLSKHW